MIYFVFWLYLSSLILSSLSIFSSLLVHHYYQYSWQKTFAAFLLSMTLLQLDYTVFYFIYKYGKADIYMLDRVYMFSIFGIWTLIILSLMIFLKKILDLKGSRLIKFSIYFIAIFFLAIFTPGIILWNNIIIFCASVIYAFLLGFLVMLPVFEWKKIYRDQQKRIVLPVFFIGIIFLPLEALEYYLRIKEFGSFSFLPVGLISFVLYCMIINLINFYYNSRMMLNNKKALSEGEISKSFIEKYSITSREKEIIELLLKGKSHKEIGFEIFISPRTVNRHVYNIYQKCNVKTLIDLINVMRSNKG